MIKTLNQRMTDLERKGLTGTRAYKNLQSWALSVQSSAPDMVHTNKAGYLRVKQTSKVTGTQAKRIQAIYNNKQATAGWEMKDATCRIQEVIKQKTGRTVDPKKYEQKFKKVAKYLANKSGDLHEFITTQAYAYYGIDGGRLKQAVKRSGKLTASEELEFLALMQDSERQFKENQTQALKYFTENT